MERFTKGFVVGAVVIVPALFCALAIAQKMEIEHLSPILVATFIIVNLPIAYHFSEKNAKHVLNTFLAYTLSSLVTAVIVGFIVLIVALKAGWLKIGKIGG